MTQAKQKRRLFVQKSYRLGAEQNFRWDKALEAASALEDEPVPAHAAVTGIWGHVW